MTNEDGPISIPPTLRIEELFVEYLAADSTLSGLSIVAASDRDALVPPLHCFVYCSRATPVLSFGQNYRADVAIAVVSDIDDTDHAARKGHFNRVLRALTKKEPPYSAVAGDSNLLAWPIESIGEVSAGRQTGDVIRMNVAATVGDRPENPSVAIPAPTWDDLSLTWQQSA